jgi:hypothetical protein
VDEVHGDVVTAGTDLTPRRAAAGVFLPGWGPCVLGGVDGQHFQGTVDCQEQPPGADPFPPLRTARAGLSAVVAGGRLVTVGGFYPGHNAASTVEVLPLNGNSNGNSNGN